MGRGGEQVVNHEDTMVFPPIPSQDDRSIDPQVRDVYISNRCAFPKDLPLRFLLVSLIII